MRTNANSEICNLAGAHFIQHQVASDGFEIRPEIPVFFAPEVVWRRFQTHFGLQLTRLVADFLSAPDCRPQP